MRTLEMLRLQGWTGPFAVVTTELQFGQLVGNPMSVNVLQRMFCSLLPAIGYCEPGALVGPWDR